jgi:hypothetical protein
LPICKIFLIMQITQNTTHGNFVRKYIHGESENPEHVTLSILMNQRQLDMLSLVSLLRVNACTCLGRYSPIFRKLCTVALWCNCVRRTCVDCVLFAVQPARSQHTSYAHSHTKQQLCRASRRWVSNALNM